MWWAREVEKYMDAIRDFDFDSDDEIPAPPRHPLPNIPQLGMPEEGSGAWLPSSDADPPASGPPALPDPAPLDLDGPGLLEDQDGGEAAEEAQAMAAGEA